VSRRPGSNASSRLAMLLDGPHVARPEQLAEVAFPFFAVIAAICWWIDSSSVGSSERRNTPIGRGTRGLQVGEHERVAERRPLVVDQQILLAHAVSERHDLGPLAGGGPDAAIAVLSEHERLALPQHEHVLVADVLLAELLPGPSLKMLQFCRISTNDAPR